jgi:N-acetyl-anhydromuramyl-L-alanine amidase AmpD
MPPTIDTTSYDKAKHYPVGHGYSLRAKAPISLIIHSTNNPRNNTLFAAEAKFLFEAANVSAHFLVGKDGRVVQFLDPRRYAAWHSGAAWVNFTNVNSIGIELHHSPGDPPYPVAQEDALTALVRGLMQQFTIPPSLIETHRKVALPTGRKSDPSDWSDADFYVWRAGLVWQPYRVRHPQAVFEAPRPDAKVALDDQAEVHAGDTVFINEIKMGWAHLANGLGFLPIGILEAL